MWEDNNPLAYGSSPPGLNFNPHQNVYGRPSSPSTASSDNEPPDFTSKRRDTPEDEEAPDTASGRGLNDEDDEDEEEEDFYGRRQKKGGYASRVEQILWENNNVEIFIVDAGKNVDGSGGNFIVYTIRTGV